jgi:hypothetical protein
MNSGDFCSALFGGIATDYRIDLLQKQVRMTVEPARGTPVIAITFHSIRMLGWACDDIAVHDRLELSVVGLERADDGIWKVYFNPWDSAELEFECDRITMDGTEVIYTGDCFEG